MIEKINGNGGMHEPGKPGRDLFRRQMSFTLPGIHHYELKTAEKGLINTFILQKADIININNALNRLDVEIGHSTNINYFGDTLKFKVSDIHQQEIFIELFPEIEHIAKSPDGVHLRPSNNLIALFQERYADKGMQLFAKNEIDNEWVEVKKIASVLTNMCIERGQKINLKVEGGTAELRQKAILDMMLSLQNADDRDLAEYNSIPVQNAFTFLADFSGVNDPTEKTVYSYDGRLPHANRGDIAVFPGRIVTWSYYKDFSAVKSAYEKEGKKEVDGKDLADIFRRIIDNYDALERDEKDVNRKDDWKKFKDLFITKRDELFKRIEQTDKITFSLLEKFFDESKGDLAVIEKTDGKVTGKAAEDQSLIVNYIVKGLLKEDFDNNVNVKEDDLIVKGEDDKKLKDEKEKLKKKLKNMPVILLTPSLTPKEAETLSLNTVVVLVSDMVPNSHPEMILNKRGIKMIIPEGEGGNESEITKLVRSPNDIVKDPRMMASVITGQQRIWLNMGLPEHLYQYLVFSKKIEAAETLRDLAFNGLPRKLRGGRRVLVKANVGSEDIKDVNILFKLFRPDGIGLFRIELREIFIGRQLTEKEGVEHVVGLCDAATLEVKGVKFHLPVTVRVTDVADAGKRDPKKVPGIINKGKLSGTDFLLSEEGRKILREDFRIYLKAHIQRPGQISVMIPDVKTEAQYKEVRKILQEVKDELVQDQKLNVTMDQLKIPLGGMIENKQASEDAEELTREGHFCPIGMNDLRYSMGRKTTILDPDMIKIIDTVIQKAKRTATPVSSCGKIVNDSELEALMALGVDVISVDFYDIPRCGRIIRSFHQEGLKLVKKEILEAESKEAIIDKLEAGLKHMDNLVKLEAERVQALGFNFQRQEESARFDAIHSEKIRIIDNVLKIIGDEQQDKASRILDFMEKLQGGEIQKEYNFSPCKCTIEDVNKWLENGTLFIPYLDGWELKEVIGKDCRRTPYIIHKEPDGTLWGRALPQGVHQGSNSRYYPKKVIAPGFPGEETSVEYKFQMNFFDYGLKTINSASCDMKLMPAHEDRYLVAVPTGTGQVDLVQVLEREEGGEKVYYRMLSGEKVFIAQVMMDNKKVPSHAAITEYATDKLHGVLITDRERLSEIANIGVPDIASSFKRDRTNVFYKSEDEKIDSKYNVNQIMYLKMKQIDPDTIYIMSIDNWIQNQGGTFMPLLDNPMDLVYMMNFLSVEIREGEMIERDIDEKKDLKYKNRSLEAQLNNEKRLSSAKIQFLDSKLATARKIIKEKGLIFPD